MNLTDPTGHFSQEAIEQYLQENHDDWESVLAAWMSDADWWGVLRAAEAGDTLLASYYGYWSQGLGTAGASEYAIGGSTQFTFTGSGRDVLSGISFDDKAFFTGHRIGLNDVFTGHYESGFGNYMDAYETKWSAISVNITWGALLHNGVIPSTSGGDLFINHAASRMATNTWDQLKGGYAGIAYEEIGGFIIEGAAKGIGRKVPGGLLVDIGLTTYTTISEADYTDGNIIRHQHEWYADVPGGVFKYRTITITSLYNVHGSSQSFQAGVNYR